MEPEDIDSVLEQANKLLEEGRPADSLRCLAQLQHELIDADDRIEHAALRAYALSEMGRGQEAVESLQPLLEEFPDSPRLLGTLGVVLSGANDLEEARAVLETAAALDRQDETVAANLALVYEKLRDYRTATRLYDRAIRLGADLDWALQRKAAAQREAGQTRAARATLKRYLCLVPEDAAQWITLAVLHSEEREFEAAFAAYRRSEALAPDSPALRMNWGMTAVLAGELGLAREQLAALRRADADSSRPLLLQALVLEEEGNLRGAVRTYQRAIGRAAVEEPGIQAGTFEMAMEFFARRAMRARCERLLRRAYHANACTLELCGSYRELTGRTLARATWYELVIEADYRPGLVETRASGDERHDPAARYQRNIQVIAPDHDEATTLALAFLRHMGETRVRICAFLREEPVRDAPAGIYEVERESLVL